MGTRGQAWIQLLRTAVSSHNDLALWQVTGEGVNQMDVSQRTFDRFPLMIALMMGTVLLVIGFAFNSIVAPIRAVLCLLWMLVVTFGLAVLVFQNGALSFLNTSQLDQRPTGA